MNAETKKGEKKSDQMSENTSKLDLENNKKEDPKKKKTKKEKKKKVFYQIFSLASNSFLVLVIVFLVCRLYIYLYYLEIILKN